LSTREIGETNDRTEVLQCTLMKDFECQNCDLEYNALSDTQPVQIGRRIYAMIEAS
jgi:hypothetical protein